MNKLIGILIILGCVACHTKNECSYIAPSDINDGLQVSTLEKNNLNRTVFDKINQDICKGKYGNIHSLLVIENDQLVIEQYFNGWKRDRLHFMASNTKSLNSILIGIAIEQGKIKSVDQRMLDFFPAYKHLKEDSLKNKISLKDLLTMTSGFRWDEKSLPIDHPDNMGVKMDKMKDWLKASLELEMDTIPGKKYVYCGPNSIILGEIIRESTGRTVADFGAEMLFKPMGIEEYDWISKNRVYDTGGGLKLKPRDIAKYGLLHLNRGKWKEFEIVSAKWIEETFNPYIEIKHPYYSCYQWQLAKTELGFDVWFIPGNGGQIINIVPALNMVIVVNADNRNVSKEKITPLEYLLRNIIMIHPKLRN